MNWMQYFNKMAKSETEEYKKVGWGTKESMYAKFFPLFHRVDLSKINNFLDVGPGTGALEVEIAHNFANVKIYGIDISEELRKVCTAKGIKNAEFQHGSITDIPFEDGKFDLVVNIGVLQNFNGSMDRALDELCRVVCVGGFLYMVALDGECNWYKDGTRVKNPLNQYNSPDQLIDELISRGFQPLHAESISVTDIESMRHNTDFILPLHETHTFYILAKRDEQNLNLGCEQ